MSLLSPLLFPAPPPSYTAASFPGELLWIPLGPDCGDHGVPGGCVPALLLRYPHARFLLLYFHSNGEDIGQCHIFAKGLSQVLEVNVLLAEYPGYGICPGRCSEALLWQVSTAAYHFATRVLRVPTDDIILMGRSLGTSLATRLACTFPCHGLMLVAPFFCLCDVAKLYVGRLAEVLLGNPFPTYEFMKRVQVPTLVVHGKEDRMVPFRQGEQLLALCPQKRKLFVSPPDLGHNDDLLGDPDYLVRHIYRFFSFPDYNFAEDLRAPPAFFDPRLCAKYRWLAKAEEPCALPRMGPGPKGPQNKFAGMKELALRLARGDLDNLDGTVDVSVFTDRGQMPVSEPHQPDDTGPGDSSVGDTQSTTDGSGSGGRTSPCMSGRAADAAALPGWQLVDIDRGINRFLRESSLSELL